MGCFPSKPEAPKGLEPSSITHQTQIPIHPLHDAEAEWVVFTAGRPSFGFSQMPPSMRGKSIDQPRPQAGMGYYSRGASIDQPRPQAKKVVPPRISVDVPRPDLDRAAPPTARPVLPFKRPEFHRARSLGPVSPAMTNGNKPKVSFVAHVLSKHSEMKTIPLDDSPPMTAPATRDRF
ncbi:hypothetical protein HGRIS_008367 [Hohenbuehelia grisea]|uniref:Uncharacterized protein n=1 Tax=Hohenbuehelia grisea TaxID=104357 RepID=A0ABR3J7R2_9AGAR